MFLRAFLDAQRRNSTIAKQKGFTLLELVMVMTIIVILAAMGVVAYQRLQLKARETILKTSLKEMRKMIDQYQADKEHLPGTLDDLVSAGYLHDVPVDPVTGEKDWATEMGEDTVAREGGQGMVDVHSNATGVDSEGTAYKDY
jgi:general secretion pathway protein G